MTSDSPLTPDSRRNFVKKSLAASIIAAQPTILAGLIRAEGGGGTGTTAPWETTNSTNCPNTTSGWDTTVPETTTPYYTTETTELPVTTAEEHDINSIVVTGNADVVTMTGGGTGGSPSAPSLPSEGGTTVFDIDIPGKLENISAVFKIKFWQYPASIASFHPSTASVLAQGEFYLWAPDSSGTWVNKTKNTPQKQCTAVCDPDNGIISATIGGGAASTGSSATWSQGSDVFEVKIEIKDVVIDNNNTTSITFKGKVDVTVTKNSAVIGTNPERPFEIVISSHLHN